MDGTIPMSCNDQTSACVGGAAALDSAAVLLLTDFGATWCVAAIHPGASAPSSRVQTHTRPSAETPTKRSWAGGAATNETRAQPAPLSSGVIERKEKATRPSRGWEPEEEAVGAGAVARRCHVETQPSVCRPEIGNRGAGRLSVAGARACMRREGGGGAQKTPSVCV